MFLWKNSIRYLVPTLDTSYITLAKHSKYKHLIGKSFDSKKRGIAWSLYFAKYIMRKARFWRIRIFLKFVSIAWPHTQIPKLRYGLIRDWYSCFKVCLGMKYLILDKIPMVLLILRQIYSIWCFQDRLKSTITPRYLT